MFNYYAKLPKLFMKLTKTQYGKNLKMRGYPFIYGSKKGKIKIGDNVTINSSFLSNLLGLYQKTIIVAYMGGNVEIGNDVGISGSTIFSRELIKIGDFTKIGANSKIIDNDFHPVDPQKRLENDNSAIKTAPIIIGKNVFIGCNSIILKGTTIGNNSVVGAGSVVHGDFGDNVVIAGNPARIVKELK